MKVLVIDNFDLLTYNLADEFSKRNCEVVVYRNDVDMKILDAAIKKFRPQLIILSSGPGNTTNSGNSIDVIRNYAGKMPIVGVGLGYQCIIEAFGGNTERSALILHGKVSEISHDGKTIFRKLDSPFSAGIYTSASSTNIPYSLEVSARDENDIVMGVRHKDSYVEGIQFHPESILTPSGSLIIDNIIQDSSKK